MKLHEWSATIAPPSIVCSACGVVQGTNRSDECRGAPPTLGPNAHRCDGGRPPKRRR